MEQKKRDKKQKYELEDESMKQNDETIKNGTITFDLGQIFDRIFARGASDSQEMNKDNRAAKAAFSDEGTNANAALFIGKMNPEDTDSENESCEDGNGFWDSLLDYIADELDEESDLSGASAKAEEVRKTVKSSEAAEQDNPCKTCPYRCCPQECETNEALNDIRYQAKCSEQMDPVPAGTGEQTYHSMLLDMTSLAGMIESIRMTVAAMLEGSLCAVNVWQTVQLMQEEADGLITKWRAYGTPMA